MNKKALISFFILFNLISIPQVMAEVEDEAINIYNEAIDFYEKDDTNVSIELFKKAIDISPDFYEAHYNLAQIYMSLDKDDEALVELNIILKLKPENSENLYNLGKLYFKKGQLSKSHENLEKIKEEAPQYKSAQILIEKIEKRQKEFIVENKIKERQNVINPQGKLKGVELGEFNAPSGIALDNRGNIYIASFTENQIYKISISGEKTVFSKSSLIQGPIGLAIDSENNIYISNYIANNIVKISPQGVASIFADVKKPYCLNYDKEHNRLYTTEQSTNKLIKFDL